MSRSKAYLVTIGGPLLLAAVACLPRCAENQVIQFTLWGSALLLLGGLLAIRKKPLEVIRHIRRPHWVQILTHGSIFAYWGYYVEAVVDQAELFLAQLVFAYVLDLFLSWWRRGQWLLGFGPVPIIGSINLFLWMKDDWWWLQLVMVVLAFGSREVVRWQRNGRSTHIFNPSALALASVSLVLIACDHSHITWGQTIATTLNAAPYMFELLFAAGLLVGYLFGTSMTTVGAAVGTVLIGLIYHRMTGWWFFISDDIPIAVFLGMNLLITDPATSPRTPLARLLFGAGYGVGVFLLYWWLQVIGQPAYFDKLIQVPILNLLVPVFALGGAWLARWTLLESLSTRRWLQVGGWLLAFMLIRPGLIDHPGAKPSTWQLRCEAGVPRACANQRHALGAGCGQGDGAMCFGLYEIIGDEKSSWYDRGEAARLVAKACTRGHAPACQAMKALSSDSKPTQLNETAEGSACDGGDAQACTRLGTALLRPDDDGIRRTADAAARLGQGCAHGAADACINLGLMTLRGDGVPGNPAEALRLHERACDLGLALGCTRTAALYHQGRGVPADAAKARVFMERACKAGDMGACVQLRQQELKAP